MIFDYEKWVYQRKDAYPMVEGDKNPNGGMTAKNPKVKTVYGWTLLQDGDEIFKTAWGHDVYRDGHLMK